MTNKEIIQELAESLILALENNGGQTMLLKPALNVVKIKMANLSETDSADILDKVHFISARIEQLSGKLSPYHLDTVDAGASEIALIKS